MNGYRDGASDPGWIPHRLRTRASPPWTKENPGGRPIPLKGGDLDREDSKQPQEAPQGLNADGDRLTLPKASRSQWSSSQWSASQMPRELREWMTAHVDDMPNFVCDYTERTWERGDSELSKWHQGEVRFIDGEDDYRVLSVNGKSSKKKIWQVSGFTNSFVKPWFMLHPENNYRFESAGPGYFSFQSDHGVHVVHGYTRTGEGLRSKPYPTWGTVWVDDSHAFVKIEEHMTSPEGDSMFGGGGSYTGIMEYGSFDLGGRSYQLLKRHESIARDLKGNRSYRVVRTYDNYRRFQAESSIQYGNVIDGLSATPASKRHDAEVAAAQPGFKRAAGGGMGGELPPPTLAHETGLEVDADLPSAKSPNLSPQDPRAASQPPLSKAVRTSTKRPPPPKRRTPSFPQPLADPSRSSTSLTKPTSLIREAPSRVPQRRSGGRRPIGAVVGCVDERDRGLGRGLLWEISRGKSFTDADFEAVPEGK